MRRIVQEAIRSITTSAPTHSPHDEPLLSVNDLKEKLGVSRDLIYRMPRRGKIPEHVLGRRKLFKLSEVLQAMKSGGHWYLAVFFEQVKTRDFLTLTVQI